jgi:hypothetical protein
MKRKGHNETTRDEMDEWMKDNRPNRQEMRENGIKEIVEEDESEHEENERESVVICGEEETNDITVPPPVMEMDEGKEKSILVKEKECLFRMIFVSVGLALILEFMFTVDPGDEERFETTETPLKSIDSFTPIDPFTTIDLEDDELSS